MIRHGAVLAPGTALAARSGLMARSAVAPPTPRPPPPPPETGGAYGVVRLSPACV